MYGIKPNPNKQILINADGQNFLRIPIKTVLFKNGDIFQEKICSEITFFLEKNKEIPELLKLKKWYVVVSEKIIAISQGRSFFIKDIKPSFFARQLCKYVKKTSAGIGLGSPWTMELAIREAGILRIVIASFFSVIAKLFGVSGVFYKIVGSQIGAIDGPTKYSLYPSNVSAKLAPKNPQQAAQKIRDEIKGKIVINGSETHFGGAVIIDANDLGRNVLGNATNSSNSFFEKLMADNPMGQTNEQTPIIIAIRK